MAINSFPISTTPAAANLISFAPTSGIASTDVQSAIAEVKGLIPSVGSGTDPLALIHGMTVSTNNALVTNDPNDGVAVSINAVTDCSATNPGFTDDNAMQVTIHATHGQNTNGGLTTAKRTFIPLLITGNYNAAGQKFAQTTTINAFGMGDSAIYGNLNVNYAGGPVNGDEGQGWGLVSELRQQTFLNTTTITSIPTPSTLNTTTTQSITASKNIQTVTVASSTGANIGDWVIIEQQVASGAPNLEAVQLTAVGPGTISGVFMYTHNSGVTVKPALRLFCASTFQMGQDRLLVNMSQPSYSVGTVTAPTTGFSTAAFTGSGTTWTNTMVGGNALNIGAISLANDDYTDSPFDSGANRLRAWYQITSVASNTSLVIWSMSVAGDTSYKGKGCGAGTYVIRPSAKVLRVVHSGGNPTGEIICENSTSTWTVGDTVEEVICPYADVTGFQYHISNFTNGGTLRSFMDVRNNGARTFQSCILFGQGGGVISTPSADGISWDTCLDISIADVNTGIKIQRAHQQAILLETFATAGFSDSTGRIAWHNTNTAFMGFNSTNGGIELNNNNGSGRIALCNPSSGPNVDNINGVVFNRDGNHNFLVAIDSVLKLVPIAFSLRPGTPTQGMICSFTDSNTATWGATVAGGGTNKIISCYNGTNWTVMGA